MPTWRPPAGDDLLRLDPQEVFEAGLRNHHVCNTAYPIAHQRTWAPYRVRRADADAVARSAWEGITDLGLYVHVPFCEVRCSFCEYTVTRRQEHARVTEYVDAVSRELSMYAERLGGADRTVHGLDVGGGTPSFIDAEHVARLVEQARATFRFDPGGDVSIETTPRIAAAEPRKIAAYRRAGIDRISMGIQVVQPDLLRVLGREGNGVEHHHRAVEHIRAAGFDRFNVDLMYGFRDQSLESWRATLEHAIALGPEYVTLYRMRYKLTRISDQASAVTMDHVRPMARLAKAMLADAGYRARPGKTTYSRIEGDVGTSSYLARRVQDGMPYLGLGLGAQSFTHTTIAYNDGAVGKNLVPYLRSVAEGRLPLQDLYDLPAVQMMGKMCAVSFYFGEIRGRAFEDKFGVTLRDAYPEAIALLLDRGLMEDTGESLALTPRGVDDKPGVHALFHAPAIQRYLVERDPDDDEDAVKNRRLALRVAGDARV